MLSSDEESSRHVVDTVCKKKNGKRYFLKGFIEPKQHSTFNNLFWGTMTYIKIVLNNIIEIVNTFKIMSIFNNMDLF